ncbi:hypothetical protein ACGF1Z_15490 [Streptomyces sp. NPDC048018]|uniref:hypothetical protein n=1 Tax=Streptomyces sp. NPDC048018 TaxID=3365499 RepID=UPI00371DE3AB
MHATRTTVTLLAGMAMAALTGCVAVEPPPTAPAPAPSRAADPAGQDVAPQIVQGPAREALEAAMPDEPAPGPRPSAGRPGPGGAGPARPHRTERPHPSAVPRPRPYPDLVLPALPKLPRDRADVCALGESYGGWSPGSDQARICRGGYGR